MNELKCSLTKNSAALLYLTQLQNISATSSTKKSKTFWLGWTKIKADFLFCGKFQGVIQATSLSSERNFSCSGFLVFKLRNDIYPQIIRGRLEAFEIWTWRNNNGKYQLEGSHDKILCVRSKRERTILNSILERKKRWLGHILRGESLVKDVIEGRLEGKRGRGKPRIMMLDVSKLDQASSNR